jgi:hypothetical protein
LPTTATLRKDTFVGISVAQPSASPNMMELSLPSHIRPSESTCTLLIKLPNLDSLNNWLAAVKSSPLKRNKPPAEATRV